MRKLRLGAVLTVFSQEHASPIYGVIRETGDATHRLDQLMVVIAHLGLLFQFHFVHVPAACTWLVAVSLGEWESTQTAGCRQHYCANFRLRCDTIDDSGGSTQRDDDEDKCAK